jgi:hypothetical protein
MHKCLCDTIFVDDYFEETRSMEQVISKDGTLIAYERGGTGYPLVLIRFTALQQIIRAGRLSSQNLSNISLFTLLIGEVVVKAATPNLMPYNTSLKT